MRARAERASLFERRIEMARKKDAEIKSYKLKNGKTYYKIKAYIGIDPETGKEVRITRSKLKTRKEAEDLRNELKAKGPHAVLNNLRKSSNRKTVSDVFKIWIDIQRMEVRGSTVNRFLDTWRNHTEPNFGNDYIDAISSDHIQRYVNDLASKYTTYKNQVSQLHRLITYAIFRGWAKQDPFASVLIPKKSKKEKRDTSHNFYEHDELKEFLQAMKEYNLAKYTYFLTVASLGCRRAEGLALTWEDINFDRRTVSITKTVSKDENGQKTINPVKNGVSHIVPMSDNLYSVLKEYRQHCDEIGDTNNLLFHQNNGKIHWTQQVDIWIKRFYIYNKKQVEKWNTDHPNSKPRKPIRQITPHGLRHTLATLLYEGNPHIKPQDIQFMLGHKTVKTSLNIYTHVTKKQKKDIKDSINNLDL